MLLIYSLISDLYDALVVRGDHAKAESILSACATADLIDLRLQNPHARPTTTWKRIWDTSNGPFTDRPPSSRTSTSTNSSSNSSFSATGDVPSPRGGHVSVFDTTHGTMYLFGGWDGSQDLGDFWAYSIPTGRWTRLSANTLADGGPSARSCGAAVFDEATGYIYFLGRYMVRMSAAEKRRIYAGQVRQMEQQQRGDQQRGDQREQHQQQRDQHQQFVSAIEERASEMAAAAANPLLTPRVRMAAREIMTRAFGASSVSASAGTEEGGGNSESYRSAQLVFVYHAQVQVGADGLDFWFFM